MDNQEVDLKKLVNNLRLSKATKHHADIRMVFGMSSFDIYTSEKKLKYQLAMDFTLFESLISQLYNKVQFVRIMNSWKAQHS